MKTGCKPQDLCYRSSQLLNIIENKTTQARIKPDDKILSQKLICGDIPTHSAELMWCKYTCMYMEEMIKA